MVSMCASLIGELRPQDHREQQALAGRGRPAATRAAAARALRLGDDHGALGRALQGEGLGLHVRRLDLVVIAERVAEHAVLGALRDVAHGEAGGLVLESVAAARHADDAVAALAQRLHVLVHGVAGDAEDVADGLAGDEVVAVSAGCR